jgi:hypothetical protein
MSLCGKRSGPASGSSSPFSLSEFILLHVGGAEILVCFSQECKESFENYGNKHTSLETVRNSWLLNCFFPLRYDDELPRIN